MGEYGIGCHRPCEDGADDERKNLNMVLPDGLGSSDWAINLEAN
jgi:hypothetical protein